MTWEDQLRAINSNVMHLRGPAGLDQLSGELAQPTAPRPDPRPRVQTPGDGRLAHADPTPAAAVDPTHAATIRAKVQVLLELVDENLCELVAIAAKEHRRVTSTLPLPTQKPIRYCESCWRVQKADGKPYDNLIDSDRYARFCRLCGDWKATRGHVPPVGLVEWWRQGHNTNNKAVADAYAAEGRTPPELKAAAT